MIRWTASCVVGTCFENRRLSAKKKIKTGYADGTSRFSDRCGLVGETVRRVDATSGDQNRYESRGPGGKKITTTEIRNATRRRPMNDNVITIYNIGFVTRITRGSVVTCTPKPRSVRGIIESDVESTIKRYKNTIITVYTSSRSTGVNCIDFAQTLRKLFVKYQEASRHTEIS